MDPFHEVTWLNSCLQETLLPSSPWHKVANLICEKLAKLLEPRLSRPEIRQSLYELLGDPFVRNYFQSHSDEPMVLEPPFMQLRARQETKAIAERLLSDAVDSVIREFRSGLPSSALQEFEQLCSHSVLSGVHQQMQGVSAASGFSHSETIGLALGCILQRQPEQLTSVCKKLIGRLLPQSLRGCIWSMRLEGIVAELTRIARKDSRGRGLDGWNARLKRFEEMVYREMETKGYGSPLISPISGLIHRSVEQAYDSATSMVDQQWRTLIENVLNCVYTSNKTYEPTHVYLSFPVLVAFSDRKCKNDESRCIELAGRLSEVVAYCLPTPQALSDISGDVIKALQQTDELLCSHLISIARQASLGRHQEFLSKLVAAGSTKQSSSVLGPEVFIKKWITEGFVSVLGYYSMLFVWDQLFLADWQAVKIQQFCIAILKLLKTQIMAAQTFQQLHKVLLYEPCQLFLKDIQAEWLKAERSD